MLLFYVRVHGFHRRYAMVGVFCMRDKRLRQLIELNEPLPLKWWKCSHQPTQGQNYLIVTAFQMVSNMSAVVCASCMWVIWRLFCSWRDATIESLPRRVPPIQTSVGSGLAVYGDYDPQQLEDVPRSRGLYSDGKITNDDWFPTENYNLSSLGGAAVRRRTRDQKGRWFDSRPGHYQVN